MLVTALYISPGHNFYQHRDGVPGSHPTLSVSSVECVAEEGLRGDRFFGYKDDYLGQATFFSGEVYDELCAALRVDDKSDGVFRRNIITRGVDLNDLVGREFELQGVRFSGTEECSPCRWMDHAFGPGAHRFLRGRGGLRARILTSGWLHVAP